MTGIFSLGKGTLNICAVTQFKELRHNDVWKSYLRLEKKTKPKNSNKKEELPYPSLESQVLLFIITAVVAEHPFVQSCHYQLLYMLHYLSDLSFRKTLK